MMAAIRNTVVAALLGAAVGAVTPALAQVPADSGTRELRQRLLTLQQQLDELDSARDPASQQRLMQQSWHGMQAYMDWMRESWGVGYPWMMGDREMGCPMMGGGSMRGWSLPQGMSPTRYGQRMRNNMQVMLQQMNEIARSPDSLQRQHLLQAHWQTMYEQMQTMRGMGWMWAGPMGPGMMWRPMPDTAAAKPLPEPGSRGATLVANYCTQCHAAPSPTLHTAGEWRAVTNRMQLHMSSLPDIKTPSTEEMRIILAYMQRHAR